MEGREYFFIGRERFLRMIEQGEFLEWAEYSDNLYGTPTAAVSSWLAGGTDVILEIELQGARQIRRRMPEAVLIFIAPPGIEELEQRLRLRNTESEESIVRRLTHAEDEMAGLKTPGNGGNGSWGHPEFDYVIVNDDVEKAARDLHGVIDEIRSQDPMR
jgi:guanylate kinase